jgi:signal transduction histidine kinase
MAAGANWEPNRRSDLFDIALTAVMAVGAGVSLYIGGDPLLTGELADYDRGVGISLLVLVIAPLALRRRYPLTVLAVMTAGFVPMSLFEIPEAIMSLVAMFIGLYTAGAYGGPRRHLARGAVAAAILGIVAWATFDVEDYEGRVPVQLVLGYNAFQVVFFLAAAWMLGDLVSTRREREATLEAQAGQLREAQAERATQAVLEERVRIARELHDVVAHHVSVMGVQAGAARRVLDRQPEAVPELLSSVEESSRQAVAELQRMLGLLRRDEGGGAGGGCRDPQPTLAQLGLLADQMRQAGLDVTTAVEGDTDGLPASVDLSAFRIVQEALTNTLKHAGPGAAADVSVVRRPGSLEVAVADNGTATVARNGLGHGLLGMQERVGSLGGELRIEQRLGQGFSVRVWLPLVAQGDPA